MGTKNGEESSIDDKDIYKFDSVQKRWNYIDSVSPWRLKTK